MVLLRYALWGNGFSTKNLSYLVSCKKNSETKKFPKHRMVPSQTFWHCQTKLSRSKYGIPTFLCVEIIDTKVYFETHQGSTTKKIGTLKRQSDKNVIHPLMNRFLQDQKKRLLKHQRVHLRKFSKLWDKKCRREIVISPTLFAWIFPILPYFWKKEEFLYKLLSFRETKTFDRKSRNSKLFFYLKVFSIP